MSEIKSNQSSMRRNYSNNSNNDEWLYVLFVLVVRGVVGCVVAAEWWLRRSIHLCRCINKEMNMILVLTELTEHKHGVIVSQSPPPPPPLTESSSNSTVDFSFFSSTSLSTLTSSTSTQPAAFQVPASVLLQNKLTKCTSSSHTPNVDTRAMRLV